MRPTVLSIAIGVAAAAAGAARSQAGQGVPPDRSGITRVGGTAPDFTLPTLDQSAEITLSSYRGERPVALVFGSYT